MKNIKINYNSKIFFSSHFLAFTLFNSSHLKAEWDDLFEENKKFYGLEKELKYPVNAFIIEKEEWEDHNSFMFLGLLKSTEYPKYKSLYFLNYYSLESKIDNRKKNIFFPFYFNKREKDKQVHINPFYYSYKTKNESNKSLFWFWYMGNNHKSNIYYNTLIPIWYYKNQDVNSTSNIVKSNSIFLPFFGYTENYTKNKITNSEDYKLTNLSPLHFYMKKNIIQNGKNIVHEKKIFFPIIPIGFYYNRSKDNTVHKNLLTIIDWKINKENGISRFWLTPIIYHKKNSYNIVPILSYYNFYDRKNDFKMQFPLFFRYKTPTELTFGFPFIPILYYNHENIEYDQYNIFSAIYIKRNKLNKKLTFNSPFFQYKTDSYHGILPLYFWTKDSDGSEKKYTPLFYSITNNKHRIKKLITPLFFYSKNNKQNKVLGYPIVPFFWLSFENEKTINKRLLTFINWEIDKNSGKSLKFIFPPFIYKKNSYNGIIPLYLNYFDNDGNEKIITPISYFVKNKKKNESININPFYISKNNSNFKYIGWPILPFIYYKYNNNKIVKNRLLSLISWERSIVDKSLNSFYFNPLFFYKKNKYHGILPIYFYNKSNDGSESTISILGYSRRSKTDARTWCFNYYSYEWDMQTNDPNHIKMFLPLYFSWYKNKKSLNISPFGLTYESPKDYFHVNILGISKSQSIAQYIPGADIGSKNGNYYVDLEWSFLYNLFSLSTRRPLNNFKDINNNYNELNSNPEITKNRYVSRENSIYYWGLCSFFGLLTFEAADTKRHFRLFPLWWLTWDKNSDDKLQFIPFGYFNYTNKDLSYKIIFPGFIPIYGSQQNGDSYKKAYGIIAYWREYDARRKHNEFSILWPLINKYENPNENGGRIFPILWYKNWKKNNFNISKIISPLWYKYEKKSVINKNIKEGINLTPLFYNSYKYKDGKFYNTFWIPILPLWYQYENQNQKEQNLLFGLYSNKKNYINHFQSNSLLYGLIYNKNEYTNNNFIITNKTSNTSWLIPLFYSNEYNDGISNKSLSFVLPGFFKRVKNDSYTKGFLSLYLKEYNANINKTEYTFFWPIINYYKSNNNFGYRIFPFLWYKSFNNDNRISKKITTPISYYHKTNYTNGDFEYFNLTPICYSKYEQKGNYYDKTFWFPLLPIYYAYENNTYKSNRLLYSLLSFYKNKKSHYISLSIFFNLIHNEKYYNNSFYNDSNIIKTRSWFLPIYYSSKEYIDNRMLNSELIIGPYFYHKKIAGNSYKQSYLYNFISKKYNDKNNKYENSYLWSFYTTYKYNENNYGGRIFPIAWSKVKNNKKEAFVLPFLAYKSYYNNGLTKDEKKKFIWPLGFYNYEISNEKYERYIGFPIIPLFYNHKKIQNGLNSNYYNIAMLLSWESTNNKYDWFRFAPLYFYSNKKYTNYQNGYSCIPLIFYKGWDEKYSSIQIGPYWHSKDFKKDEESNHYFMPFIFNWKNKTSKTKFWFGWYNHKEKFYERNNIIGLFDFQKNSIYNTTSSSALFGILWKYNKSNQYKKFTALFGSLINYKNDYRSDNYNIDIALIFSDGNKDSRRYSYLLPLYYHNRDQNSLTQYYTPLYIHFINQRKEFLLGGLGAWYKNKNFENGKGSSGLLGGLLFKSSYDENRNYKCYNSLFGLIWEYEKESEADFQKFSILKFLYKKVKINNKITHRILGVKIHESEEI